MCVWGLRKNEEHFHEGGCEGPDETVSQSLWPGRGSCRVVCFSYIGRRAVNITLTLIPGTNTYFWLIRNGPIYVVVVVVVVWASLLCACVRWAREWCWCVGDSYVFWLTTWLSMAWVVMTIFSRTSPWWPWLDTHTLTETRARTHTHTVTETHCLIPVQLNIEMSKWHLLLLSIFSFLTLDQSNKSVTGQISRLCCVQVLLPRMQGVRGHLHGGRSSWNHTFSKRSWKKNAFTWEKKNLFLWMSWKWLKTM